VLSSSSSLIGELIIASGGLLLLNYLSISLSLSIIVSILLTIDLCLIAYLNCD